MGLEGDALRLAELDQNVEQSLRQRNTEDLRRALTEYAELRISVQHARLDEDVVSTKNPRARDVLLRISSGEGLPADDIMRALGEVTGDSDLVEFGELTDADVEELGSRLLYSWYSHHEYVTGLAELRPLILECDPAGSVKRLLREAKHCYAFQQYDATLAMCRTLLEASIRDICQRRGLLPEADDSLNLLERYSWGYLRNKVSSGSLNDKLKVHYDRLCEVIHARRSATAGEAFTELREMLSVIEELYEIHGP